jgi:hypothetical protein
MWTKGTGDKVGVRGEGTLGTGWEWRKKKVHRDDLNQGFIQWELVERGIWAGG